MTLRDRIRSWFGMAGASATAVVRQVSDADIEAHAIAAMQALSNGENPVTAPCDFRVDRYVGPFGSGYTLNYMRERDGKQMHRAVNVGPEVIRNHDWVEMR